MEKKHRCSMCGKEFYGQDNCCKFCLNVLKCLENYKQSMTIEKTKILKVEKEIK